MPQKDHTGHRLIIKLPAMVGTTQFTPTGIMIETLCSHLQVTGDKGLMSPTEILRANGRSATNWYRWQEKEGFIEWWTAAQAEYHSRLGLGDVHKAIRRRALGNSPQDAKLYLERFDKEYKPTTAQEHKFPGLEPPEDLPGAIERSKERAKLVASEVVEDRPETPQDGIED